MKSPYDGMSEIPITLTCGCDTTWADGFDLFEAGQPAYCPEHGDVDVESIDVPPEEEGRETSAALKRPGALRDRWREG